MKTSDILRILQEKQDVNSSDTEQVMTFGIVPLLKKNFLFRGISPKRFQQVH